MTTKEIEHGTFYAWRYARCECDTCKVAKARSRQKSRDRSRRSSMNRSAETYHDLREYHRRRRAEWWEKQRRMIQNPRVGHWTDAEDRIVLRDDITTREKAAMLQRGYSSVLNRMHDLSRAERATCKECGSGFWKIPAKTDTAARNGFYSRGLFCSLECAYANRRREGYDRNKRQCIQCGSEFRARTPESKLCSRRCYREHKVIHPPTACEACGALFKPQMTRRGVTRFCSTSCAGAARRWKSAEERKRRCAGCGRVFVPKDGRTKNCSRECGSKSRLKKLGAHA